MSHLELVVEDCFYSLAKYTNEYTKIADIHGMRHLGKRSAFERLLWAIIMFTNLLICLAIIIQLHAKFLHSPLIFSFTNEAIPIQEIPFPAVTICPETKTKKKLFDYFQTKNQITYGQNVSEFDRKAYEYLYLVCLHNLNYMGEERTFKEKYLTNDFYNTMEMLSPSLEDIMVSCSWMRDSTNCSKIFTKVITEAGICYSFNLLDKQHIFKKTAYFSNNFFEGYNKKNDWNFESGYKSDEKLSKIYPKVTDFKGPQNSLKVTLTLDRSDFDIACRNSLHGFKIIFGNPYHIPRSRKNYFRISPNTSFIVSIKPEGMTTSESIKRFNSRNRNCYLRSERPLKFFKIYSQSSCYLECLTNYTLLRCECVSFFMPRTEDIPVCSAYHHQCVLTAEDELEVLEIFGNLNKNKTSDPPPFCNCLPSCADLTYSIEHSNIKWDWNKYLHKNGINFEKSENTTVSQLTVYFRSNFFMKHERKELFSKIDLIAKFGGLFGLFNGMSAISVVELIYFLSLRLICNKRMYGLWTGPKN